jgi:hypothetical protein
MPSLSLTKIEPLCTAAEYELIKASRRPEIGQLDAAALKRYIAKARRLRDKWQGKATPDRRDLLNKQDKSTAEVTKRHEQKGEVFDEAVSAFEKQLDKTEKNRPTNPSRERSAEKKSPTKKVTKKMAAVSEAPKKKAVAKKAKTAKKGVYAATAKKAVKPLLKQPDVDEAMKKSASGAQSEGLVGPVNKKKQRRAETTAKEGRLDSGGVTNRRQGSISVHGRHDQAKRDTRS